MVKKFEYNIPKEKGIYMIWFSNKPCKYYIGSSKNLYKRFGEHYNMLKNNKHNNKKLQNHVNKYGLENINFCLHIVNNNLNNDELRKIESEEIKFFNSVNNGFNLTDNTICPNIIWTEEQKKNLSDKAKIRQSCPKVKEQLKINNSGVLNPNSKLSKENIEFIRTNKELNRLELSKLFNVNIRTIDRVITKRTYK